MITFEFQESSTDIKIKAIAFDEAVKPLDREISLATNYAISKAKVQSPFGKKIVGYHHCELQLYKHSKVKFKKFTCYHHFLPSQLFYFFQVGCHSRQRRIQIELYRLLSEVDSGEIAVNAVISKYYFFIQLPYHFADPSIQCNYIL